MTTNYVIIGDTDMGVSIRWTEVTEVQGLVIILAFYGQA